MIVLMMINMMIKLITMKEIQGIVHGTTLTVLNAGRNQLGTSDLAGKVFSLIILIITTMNTMNTSPSLI